MPSGDGDHLYGSLCLLNRSRGALEFEGGLLGARILRLGLAEFVRACYV